MRGKKIGTAERAKAVGIAAVDGFAAASRSTGISESAIRAWYDRPEFAELRERKQEVVEAEWHTGVQLAFRRAVELLERTDDPVKAATAGAIIFDKLALTRGQVTSRTESLTSGFDRNQQRAVRQWLAALARGESDSGGAGDAVALPSEEPAATT